MLGTIKFGSKCMFFLRTAKKLPEGLQDKATSLVQILLAILNEALNQGVYRVLSGGLWKYRFPKLEI